MLFVTKCLSRLNLHEHIILLIAFMKIYTISHVLLLLFMHIFFGLFSTHVLFVMYCDDNDLCMLAFSINTLFLFYKTNLTLDLEFQSACKFVLARTNVHGETAKFRG